MEGNDQLIITGNDKEHFVLMRLEHYNYLRECELEVARYQAKEDIKTGDFVIESVDDHIKRINNDL
jgi:PHD/YefM family antitoxin component YafN of YafNO toxin-antitoxin module